MTHYPRNPRIGVLCRNGKTVYYIYASDRYLEFSNLHVAEYTADQLDQMGV